MAFTLINARPSTVGRNVAIVMREKGIGYDVQYDVPWGDQTCTPQYSPLEQLPILITGENEYIYDSAYILDWLEARFPEPALLPTDLDARLDARKRRMLGTSDRTSPAFGQTHRAPGCSPQAVLARPIPASNCSHA